MDSTAMKAVEMFHKNLAERTDCGPEMVERFLGESGRRGAAYGDKPLGVLLRPYFISRQREQMLWHSVRTIGAILEKVIKFYLAEPQVRRMIPLKPEVERFVQIPSGLNTKIIVSRLDAFHSKDGLKYVEFNTDSPAGAAYADITEELFFEQGYLYPMMKQFRFRRTYRIELLVRALLSAYRDFGLGEAPRVVITDWEGVNTASEFGVIQDFLERCGVPAVIADPRKLDWKDGRLYADGVPVNMVYRRVILRELLQKQEECRGLIRAAEEGNTCIVNPFCTVIPGTKDVCHFVYSPEFRKAISNEEFETIQSFIPWTCHVGPEKVEFEGRSWYPVDLALEKRDQFVLKPAGGYGGVGVYAGNKTPQDVWEKALEDVGEESWVLQQYTSIPEEPFPVFSPDMTIEKRKVNLNPFMLGGEYASAIARLSTAAVINVSAGGGMVPVIPVEEKEES